jgi:DNA invertase Pin-like site-specific DNA recombinase
VVTGDAMTPAADVAVGYARRSKESGARTVSLEDQRARVTAYCLEHGWTVAEVLTDDGVSGGRRERLDRIAQAVKHHRARAVVVYHLDRFARDVAALLDALRSMSRRGVELHVVGRGRVEVESASGFLLTGIEGVMHEHFRRAIGEKTRDALARLRATGRRYSRIPPYGYRVVAVDQLQLERDPDEQAALALIRSLAPARSLRALSRALAARGILARCGRPFTAMTLSRLVSNRPVGYSRCAVTSGAGAPAGPP